MSELIFIRTITNTPYGIVALLYKMGDEYFMVSQDNEEFANAPTEKECLDKYIQICIEEEAVEDIMHLETSVKDPYVMQKFKEYLDGEGLF